MNPKTATQWEDIMAQLRYARNRMWAHRMDASNFKPNTLFKSHDLLAEWVVGGDCD